jgi:hypothetical protein
MQDEKGRRVHRICAFHGGWMTSLTSSHGFGWLLAGARKFLSRMFSESPFLFEIRNIRTGEAAAQFGPFSDETQADRAAREMGRDWRVFRRETSTNEDLRSLAASLKSAGDSADNGDVDEGMNAIALFDTRGGLLEITAGLWVTALNLAMANGWKPAGTTASARRWTPEVAVVGRSPREGRYAEALGQCVTAGDAGRFAQALARGVEREVNAQLARLALFASAGSFLVCPLTADLREALQGMPRTAVGALPEELELELENLRRHVVGYSATVESTVDAARRR